MEDLQNSYYLKLGKIQNILIIQLFKIRKINLKINLYFYLIIMGITNLNDIQKYSKQYNPNTFKANTIIIDGNNLLFNRLTAIRSSYLSSYQNAQLGTINKPLLDQIILILHSTIEKIVEMIKKIYTLKLKDEKNIIIVFDPPNTPNYYIPNVGYLTLKRKEEEKRIAKQREQYLKQQAKLIDLQNMYSEEIVKIYQQLSYLNNDSNINMLMPIIKNELLYIFHKLDNNYVSEFNFNQENIDISNHVYFIQSISEADLVIYNICKILNYAPVLIRSMDSDYYVLCSQLKNVYKTDISDKTRKPKTNKYIDSPIYNIYDTWKQAFDENITYEDIIIMATMAGNDYTAKQSMYGFKVESYKRIYQHDFSKITKSATKLYPYKENGFRDIKNIIENYSETNEDVKNSLLIYKHIDDNFEFDKLNLSTIRLNDIIQKVKNELNDDFYSYYKDITKITVINQDDINEYVSNVINRINIMNHEIELDKMGINYDSVDLGLNFKNVNKNMNENENFDNMNFGNENTNENFDNMNFDNKNINMNINMNFDNINFGNVNFDNKNENMNFDNENENINFDNKNVNENINFNNENENINFDNKNMINFNKNMINTINFDNITF